MRRIFCLLLWVGLINLGLMPGASASEMVVDAETAKYFGGFTGTFVLYDAAADRYTVFNETQSQKRLSPCSTFKIYNALIALETGVLPPEDERTLINSNGIEYSIQAWNYDQTLTSATRNSVVWYFQEVAARIGRERMQAYLDKMAFGNRDISGGVSEFWLRSSLLISAREQVDMLYRVYSGQLTFSSGNIEIVKNNITQAKTDAIWFMGKTGTARQGGRSVAGWFVGCVEKQEGRYFFATNVEAEDGANSGKAREITISILRDMGILP